MIRHLIRVPGWGLVALLILSPCMHGEKASDGSSSDTDYTEEQSDAIDRADELVGRLQAMSWRPELIDALSTLGEVACRYNKELGAYAFETAYSVVAGLEFDLEDDWSMRTLWRLAAAAPRCDPSFGDRPLTRQVTTAELRTEGLLDAISESVAADPQEAARFARHVANQVHTLPSHRQTEFVRGLRELREQLPAQADGLFQNALSSVAASGTIWDLFALGNYVLGPSSAAADAVAMITVSDASAYLLSTVRPGIPKEVVSRYVGTSIETLLTRGTPTRHAAQSIALATQLASWAKTNHPEHSSTLEDLLATQTAAIGIRERLSKFHEEVEVSFSPSSLEEALESATDEESKARIRFELCMNRIAEGKFSQAEDLLDELRPELRRSLRDFIGLRRATDVIESGRLEDGTVEVAGIRDSFYRVLGALSLATAYWARSVDEEHRSIEDRDAAHRALRHATGAAGDVPEDLRPHARIAIAAVLAKCDQGEEALRLLELALQELRPEQSEVEIEEERSVVAITAYPWGGFGVAITGDGDSVHHQTLHPSNLKGANFKQAVHQLSLSPEMDLDRLDAISSMAIDPRMRAEGLVAVGTGALVRAFDEETGSPSTVKPAKSVGVSDDSGNPETKREETTTQEPI